ncbi:nicotinate (nicotinamide) nucleotide adenylyltransferase [Proteiniphilum sp.]|uniref:nicotinate (nicotinamide) nucleotide adenylyltransferase n=1 Tax=Proteiniphilum sp. TaxID=1926877 RepID=UPI002B21585B|nr:nicotinate (nicotinamide) nucleotide adenylyltransferase [Proteiniphilum sp.]MEA4919139.1 nicotinate (nicotinamide) nucleotide adenylyltransferase [Proteiniphilum sp.]
MLQQSIGIFSGSFNPIHIGHLILANYICEFTDLEEVWFVVSPHNPLKDPGDLLDDDLRLEIVRLALEEFDRMKVSDVEFHMPRPSYTIDTLTKLANEHPDKGFTLIIGGDNWRQIHRWKECEKLVNNYPLLVYPRLGDAVVIPDQLSTSVRVVDAPIVEVSSTFIRESIRNGKNMRGFLPPKVYDFIVQNGLYGHVPATPPYRT